MVLWCTVCGYLGVCVCGVFVGVFVGVCVGFVGVLKNWVVLNVSFCLLTPVLYI